MKKLVSFILAIMMVCLCAAPAMAADADADSAARSLYEMGLFRGKGTDSYGNPRFALDDGMTRSEALVMLIRLLGKEDVAAGGTYSCPFTDVAAWAKPYVGYGYANGLTKGVSSTLFGAQQPASVNMYLTFVLRALGYDDSSASPDFSWNTASEFAAGKGLSGVSGAGTVRILRGDAAKVSVSALDKTSKDGSDTLIQQLVNSGAVTAASAQQEGHSVTAPAPKECGSVTVPASNWVISCTDIKNAFPTAKKCVWSSMGMDTHRSFAHRDDPDRACLYDAMFCGTYGFPSSRSTEVYSADMTTDKNFSIRAGCTAFVLDKNSDVLGYATPLTGAGHGSSVTFTRGFTVSGSQLMAQVVRDAALPLCAQDAMEVTTAIDDRGKQKFVLTGANAEGLGFALAAFSGAPTQKEIETALHRIQLTNKSDACDYATLEDGTIINPNMDMKTNTDYETGCPYLVDSMAAPGRYAMAVVYRLDGYSGDIVSYSIFAE